MNIREMRDDDSSVSAEEDLRTILEIQQGHYQHLVSRSQGMLTVSLSLVAISVTAIAAFGNHLPDLDVQGAATASRNLLRGDIAGPLLISMAFLATIVSGLITVTMVLLAISRHLEVVRIPNLPMSKITNESEYRQAKDQYLQETELQFGVRGYIISSLVDNNVSRIKVASNRYQEGVYRLILVVLFSATTLLLYMHTMNANLDMLFAIFTMYFLPALFFKIRSVVIGERNKRKPDKARYKTTIWENLTDSGTYDPFDRFPTNFIERNLVRLYILFIILGSLIYILNVLVHM